MTKWLWIICLCTAGLLTACRRAEPPTPDDPVETIALEEMEYKIPLTNAQFDHLLRAAHGGDGEAQVIIALIYAGGYGTAKNFNEASRWLHRAQEADQPDAQAILSQLHQMMRLDPTAQDQWVRTETEKRLTDLNQKNDKKN